MDDLGKQFNEFYKKVQANLKTFPVKMANEARNFFLDSFRQQGWSGNFQKPWPRRKNNVDQGRKILVKSGKLKQSIQVRQANWQGVRVGTSLPYAAIHNTGFRGTMQVKPHFRIATRKVAKRFTKKNVASTSKSAFIRVKSKGHDVKGHSRKVNMPQRQFIGYSSYLNARIDRVFTAELKRLSNTNH